MEEIMKTAIDQELRDREKSYWDAIQRKDAAAAMEMTDDACTVAGAQGVGEMDRERLGAMLGHPNFELTSYSIDDEQFRVHQIADDVAVVSYQVREDLIVDGKPESIEAFDTSVWVRRDGQWLCASHTESLKGDPFGRQPEFSVP
jgi:ketosteroid isomerase-like protein